MKTKTLFFDRHSSEKEIDEKIKNVSGDNKIKNIAIGISTGTVLGGGGFVYTIIYE